MELFIELEMGPAVGEVSNENVEVGWDLVVLKLMFVVDFDTLLDEDRRVADIIFVAVMKFVKLDGIVKFFDLGLVRFLTKFPPHRI